MPETRGNITLKRFWNKEHLPLLVIILVAVLVRVWGIWHGLPYAFYGDEQHFVKRAVSFGSGDLNPHWFHKPAFLMYVLFFEYGVFFILGHVFGAFDSVSDFAKLFFVDPSAFYLIGRLTVAAFGVATVYITYRLGKQMLSRQIGLFAAFALSLTYAHVASSQYVKADVPTALFATMSFLFIYNIVQRGALRDYVGAGAFAGLGAATKYSPMMLLAVIVFGHFLARFPKPHQTSTTGRNRHRSVVVSFLVFWATFFLASPFNFLDPKGVEWTFQPLTKLMPGTTTYGSGGGSFAKSASNALLSFQYFAGVIVGKEGMGISLGILAVFGFVFGMKKPTRGLILLLFYLALFSAIVNVERPFRFKERHLNVIYPFLCILSAVGITGLLNLFVSKVQRQISEGSHPRVYSWAAMVVLTLPAIFWISKHDYLISHRDTRAIAIDWIRKNIEPGTKVIVDEHSVPLKMSRAKVEELYLRSLSLERKGAFGHRLPDYYKYQLEAADSTGYHLEILRRVWWSNKGQPDDDNLRLLTTAREVDYGNPAEKWGVMPLDYYVRQGYEYMVTTSDQFAVYLRRPERLNRPGFGEFYRDLFETGELVYDLKPDPWKRPGPEVRIYRTAALRDETQPGRRDGIHQGIQTSDSQRME